MPAPVTLEEVAHLTPGIVLDANDMPAAELSVVALDAAPAERDLAALLEPGPILAAGIVIASRKTGRVLFLQRSVTGDHAGEWCGPGGKIEDGEDALACARREVAEEVGDVDTAEARKLARVLRPGLDFTGFVALCDEEFTPALNDEHIAWAWAAPDNPPQPLHPTMGTLLAFMSADELGIARLMAFDGLASPQRYGKMWLFDLRITGTGVAWRDRDEEYVWRDASLYLNDEFLARCNGLPVIWKHPAKKPALDSKEFSDRVVGTIMLPYVRDEGVWGIARVYDDEAAGTMETRQMSTSPGVVLPKGFEANKIELDGGVKMLVEGKPSLIDHLAICEQGVWDKGGTPEGVRLDSIQEVAAMADDTEAGDKQDAADPVMEKLDAICGRMDAMGARLDAIEGSKADAKKDEDEKSEEAKADADDEPEAKKDSLSRADVEAMLSSRLPRTVTLEEMNELASAQAKADSVASAFGERAPAPMPGESPLAYRQRLATKYVAHSDQWKGIDLATLPSAALAVAEKGIFDSALAVAGRAEHVPPGALIERRKADDSGRVIKEFHGDPLAWMDAHKIRPRFVTGFNTQRGRMI